MKHEQRNSGRKLTIGALAVLLVAGTLYATFSVAQSKGKPPPYVKPTYKPAKVPVSAKVAPLPRPRIAAGGMKPPPPGGPGIKAARGGPPNGPKLTPVFNKNAKDPSLTRNFNRNTKPPSAIAKVNKGQNSGDIHARAKIASSSLGSPVKGLKVRPKEADKLTKATQKVGKSLPSNNKPKAVSRDVLQHRNRNQPRQTLEPKSSQRFREYRAGHNYGNHQAAEKKAAPKAINGGGKKSNISERMRKPGNVPKGTLPTNQGGHLKKAFDKGKKKGQLKKAFDKSKDQ